MALRWLVLAAVLFLASSGLAAEAFTIRTKVNDLCVGGDLHNGSIAWVNLCNKAQKDQQWVWRGKHLVVKSTLDGSQIPLCLSGAKAPNAAMIFCNEKDDWQMWTRQNGKLKNSHLMGCLATDSDPPKQGDNADLVPCDPASTNQHWRLDGAKSSGGMSGGSVFIIIVFVFSVIYIAGGMLFKIFVKGASGMEACPNVEFWRALPGLVNAGIAFTLNGCKNTGAGSTEAYEEI